MIPDVDIVIWELHMVYHGLPYVLAICLPLLPFFVLISSVAIIDDIAFDIIA